MVEIPGRYGFKLKNAGLSTTLCSSCRQEGFLKTREQGISQVERSGLSAAQRRGLPLAGVVLFGLLIAGGLWLQSNGNPFESHQDALPTEVPRVASPSK